LNEEARYTCASCGEEYLVAIDLSAGMSQHFDEDCPMCCRPMSCSRRLQAVSIGAIHLKRRSDMNAIRFLALGLALLAASALAVGDDAAEQAIKKDRKLMEGTWRAVSLEVNGNKAAENDAKKIVVINHADGTWTLKVEDKVISKGSNKIDPLKKPKMIDFTPTEGEGKDKSFVGIYEQGKTRRKLCFVESGKERPTEFSSSAGSQRILVVFEREK
jgi:uncharacterized protein (TIGR03067 family)